jgi:hypothetical protein
LNLPRHSNRIRGEQRGGPARSGDSLPPSGTVPFDDDRFRSSLCRKAKHKECEHSALIGICGCECHDWLDDLEQELGATN